MKIQTQVDVQDQKKTVRLNNLSDPIWFITDKNSSKICELDLTFAGCLSYWVMFGRKLILEWCSGYTDEKQNISCNITSVTNNAKRIYPILYWASQHVGDKPLSTWSLSEIEALAKALILNTVVTPTRSLKDVELPFRKKSTVERQFWLLIKSGDYYRQGKMHDGLLENLPSDFLSKIAETEFLSSNLEDYFDEWLEDGSFAHIPIELSILLLASAIDVIRSSKTNALIAYFRAQRSKYSQSISNVNYDIYGSRPLVDAIGFTKIGRRRKSYNDWSHFYNAQYSILESKQGRTVNGPLFSELLSIEKFDQLSTAVRDIYDACVIIFLCLTAVRIHELRNVNATDYFTEPDGTWLYKTAIEKTHHGVEQLRTMSGLVAEAADVLCELSYIDKKDKNSYGDIKLFGRCDSIDCYYKRNSQAVITQSRLSREFLSERPQAFYEKVLAKIPPEDLLGYPVSIGPHGFRHAYADFAIRRFDGSVLEAIRQHFRHRHGSTFTRTYTDKKAELHLKDLAAKKYLHELITRMVGDQSHDFTGAMALHIRNDINRINICTENQLSEYIDSVVDKLIELVPHEFGICVLLDGRQHLANCLNRDTGIPNVGGAMFEWCSGCANSLQLISSHKSNIERIVISHESYLEKFPFKTKQHETSLKVVRQGLEILKKMEES